MNIYTVGQINAYIKNMFSQDYFLQGVVVSGEVSNLKYHSSGHVYFTLKDESAILPAVMFRSNAAKMSWRLSDGDRVEASGSVGTYERSGSYQLYVSSVRKAGAGAQHEELEKLKKKLEDMGMFDPMYKKSIPKYAFTVGVVTSPTGSVIHDIRQVAARRNPGTEIVLIPAKVQGEGAAESIAAGIRSLEERGADVIIIGRGGGSDEDLSAFNDEMLARTIFDCEIPVISAVGHGDDESITDMVADVHAPTPSAAAELAVFLFTDFVRDVNMRAIGMEQNMMRRISGRRERLRQMALRMDSLSPASKLKLQKMAFAGRSERLAALIRRKLDADRNRMLLYIERYKALSPLDRIAHGFAAVSDEKGNKIASVTEVGKGDMLTLTMRDGSIRAVADSIEKRQ
ncbi:MAG: exodeoxyribonuclease VII large subunit [Lachnospiraceae bacterium]|nr:exodeoxyribonuclease VII large subunit [Lachnospiraceae bacterium]